MKVKWRVTALALLGVLIAAGFFTYLLIFGGSYTIRFDGRDSLKESDIENIEVYPETKGIVEVGETYIDNGVLCAHLTAVGKGSTVLTVLHKNYLTDDNGGFSDYKDSLWTVRVNDFGTIYQPRSLLFPGYGVLRWLSLGYFALICAVALWTFFECRRKANFGYLMVACGGIALYMAFVTLTSAYYTMDDFYNTGGRFMEMITQAPLVLLYVSMPFFFAASLWFAFSNIWLIRHEGFRPQNMLGIGLTVLSVMGMVGINVALTITSREFFKVVNTASYSLVFLESMFVSTVVSAYLSTKYKPPFDKDYLIILGCGINRDGSLTPLLKGRTDRALDFEREQFKATGKHAKFVPSGGQGSDEIISESEAMKRYLLEQGVPEEQIIKEDKSTNTDENILFSKRIIEQDAGSLENVKSAFSTTNYHIFRGYVLAKKHKISAQGLSAKTKFYFYPNAFLREFIGLLSYRRGAMLIILGVITLISVFLNYWFI